MLDDLAGKRTGERIQILRERRGLSRPVLSGLVGMSPSWLKGIEQGRRLPPRLPVLVKLAEALAVGDVAVLAGTDTAPPRSMSVPARTATSPTPTTTPPSALNSGVGQRTVPSFNSLSRRRRRVESLS